MAKGSLKTFILVFLGVFIVGFFASLLLQRNSKDVVEEYIAAVQNVEGLNFASQQRLTEHFNKHGSEFGYRSADEYLQGARRLIAGGKGTLSFTRSDGDILFYNPRRNEFAVLSADGFIRTYFKPNSGYQYWQRQIERR